MEIIIRILGMIVASVTANLIATRIVVAEGWQGAINSTLAGLLIYLFAKWVGKINGGLEDSRKKFLLFVSETLVLTAWCVFSAGVIFSWALANQPDNNSVEIKQSEVIADEWESHDSL
ncbi:MAG: hypothetical protein MRERV_13c041 [Mycoplasmataceae bacterium RV_VA103A]|nr:MAG: hypothetical protein MRERV_13c041 [Mycoplasmataceae bacterium RV_VA103A]